MDDRNLIAYGIMILMALSVAAIGFHVWYNARPRAISRQRLRDQRRYEAAMAKQAAAEDVSN